MKFIADAMLGRLARWLRLLGFDTLYYRDIKDGDLLKLAIQEGRFILTRDSHFLKIRNLRNFLIIRSEHPLDQVKEVLTSFNVSEFKPGRCPHCNGLLDSVIEKETVRDQVPEHVFFDKGNFQSCRTCGKIYWEGTHLRRFREGLGPIMNEGNPGERSV